MSKQVTVVDKAVTWLITYHPFYASVLLKREMIADPAIRTACVNARGQIRYNPDWFDSLTKLEVAFVLAHECMHYMFTHLLRRGSRNARKWNRACDGVINEMLKVCGVGTMPDKGIEFPGAEDMNAEEVYELMPDEPGDNQRGKGEPGDGDSGDGDGDPQSGDGDGDGDDGWGIGEDLDDSENLDEANRAEIEAEARVEMREAMETAKRIGGMPAVMERLVEKLLHVPTPWYEKMSRFFSRACDNDYSYGVFDRRFLHIGTYLPWFDGFGLNKCVIIVDVSGSISAAEMQEFSGHLNKILSDCLPAEVYVIYVHSHVAKKVDRYTPDDFPVVLKCDESGSTDMTQGVKWVARNHPDTDCMVVLTDGYTPFGNDPGIPTFWAITNNHKRSPWGENVTLEVAA